MPTKIALWSARRIRRQAARRPVDPVEGGARAEHDRACRRRRWPGRPSPWRSGPAAMRNGPPISQPTNAATCSQPRSSGRAPRLSASFPCSPCAIIVTHGAPSSSRSASSTSRREMPSRKRMASRYGTLNAVSAARRTTGLALKAMPSPAAASMSMSLAPSPTAMVRASGTPAAAAKRTSAVGLAGPVDDWRRQLARHDAVGRARERWPPGGRCPGPHERLDHLGEPPAHHGDLVAEPLAASAPASWLPGSAPCRRAPRRGPLPSAPRAGATRGAARPRSRARPPSPPRSPPPPRARARTRSARRSITSPCSSVESASSTMRCLARRCSPAAWTAMSTSCRPPPWRVAAAARRGRHRPPMSS